MDNRDNGNNNSGAKVILALAVLIAVLAGMYYFLNMPDRRTTGEKIGDATRDLSGGVTNATRELGNRTPADRAADAVHDAGENIRDKVNNNQ